MILNILIFIIFISLGFITMYIKNKINIDIIFPNIENVDKLIFIDDNNIYYKYIIIYYNDINYSFKNTKNF
jgi:hypothetical protein